MRDSLTLLAILLIGVLTAALVGPYLVDWGSHRALIEAKLSEAAGTPVRLSGPIDLKLLPKPVFRFGGVSVGGGAGGEPRLTAASLDAELSLTALMRGQIQVVDTVLVRPRLDVAQAPDGSFGLALPSDAAADRVAFDHLGLRDGTVALALADGRRAILSGLDLDGEAASLRGPFKATGRLGALSFRLGTGALERGRLRVKLHLEGAGDRPSLDLDGTASARPGPLGPGFDGTAAMTGQVTLVGTPAAVPWRATAKLSADRDAATAAEVELRAGADLRALIASGEGTAAYPAGSSPPRAALTLHGAGLDLDGLAVPPENSDIAAPKGLALARLLLRGVGDGAGLVSLPVRLDLAAGFDTATVDGQTLLGTSGRLGLGPESSAALALSVDGPEGAHLGLDGRVEPGPAAPATGPFGAIPAAAGAAFRGRAELRSPDLRRTAAWLRPTSPDLAAWLAAALPGRSLAASATVDASATGVTARDLDLRFDGARLGGVLSLTAAVGAERARLFADLSAEALDLDALPDLSGAAAASRGLDLDLALQAGAITIVGATGGGGALPPVSAGHVALRLTRTADDLRLERLSLEIDGATVSATASRVGAAARAEAHVAAPQLAPVIAAVSALLPTPAAAVLRARAAALSPLDATLRVEATASADGALSPTRIALVGAAAGTRLDADLSPDGPAALDVSRSPFAATLRAEAADGADLLRQIGLRPAAGATGPARLAATARGSAQGGFATTVAFGLGASTLSFAGRAGTSDVSGRLALRSNDLRPILAALGLAPAVGDIAADLAGDVTAEGSAVHWRSLAGKVGATAVAGEVSLDVAPSPRSDGSPPPVLTGRLSLDRLPAGALLGLALGGVSPAAAGTGWSAAAFAPPSAALPRGEIALKLGEAPLVGAIVARGVALTLRTAPGAVAFEDASGSLDAGTFGGTLALRRDGADASLSGHVAWADLPLAVGGLTGRSGGALDVAGSGGSPAALVGGLAGTGTVALSGAALPSTDPAAPARTLALVAARAAAGERGSTAADPVPPDVSAIRAALAAALDRGPLALGDATLPATLAGGALRTAPLRREGAVPPAPARAGQGEAPPDPGRWTAETTLTLDLGTLAGASRAALGAVPPGGGAPGAEVVVTRAGPVGGRAERQVDAAGLVEAIQARAIARAQDRIDVLDQDIRERAAFNRQLKAIQADQQAARERAEAERRAEAQARAAAARAAAQAAQAQKEADEAQKQAAAEAQRQAAAEAQRQAAAEAQRQAADAARQRVEDARVQAQVEAAARAERDKQRFIDRVLKEADPPLGAKDAPLDGRRGSARGRTDLEDPAPPPSIIQEGGTRP